LLCMGRNPFTVDKKGLVLSFRPILVKELFTTAPKTVSFGKEKITLPANTFSFSLFSKTLVCYHNPARKDTFARSSQVGKIMITFNDGKKLICHSQSIKLPYSAAVRRGEAARIDIYLK
ncbi:MAG: hypothetical protein JW867_07710, partial [Candidatus Omnitrophica bacterium]|nr:hypothetical protein [Candidatus Omnitrophota bacterium]